MKDLNKVIIYILLIGCIVLLINSTLQNCELKKEQEKFRNLQIAYRDTIKAAIERSISSRMDSLKQIKNTQTTIIKEVEKKKDEIFNLTNIDSIIKRYYSTRPVTNNPD
jgi:Flp pilus assembly protein TadB